jgi:hypothetical protein
MSRQFGLADMGLVLAVLAIVFGIIVPCFYVGREKAKEKPEFLKAIAAESGKAKYSFGVPFYDVMKIDGHDYLVFSREGDSRNLFVLHSASCKGCVKHLVIEKLEEL